MQGFIRNDPFDPKMWITPCDHSTNLEEVSLSTTTKVYTKGKRKMKSKVVADVVEALIGAFLSSSGEVAALSFLNWLGIRVDVLDVPYIRNYPANLEKLLNIKNVEYVLNYSFRDASLLVEALVTHGSYMPWCYEVMFDYIRDKCICVLLYIHEMIEAHSNV